MRRIVFAVAVLGLFAFATTGGAADIERTKAGLKLSGFYDFSDITSEFGFGVGNIGNLNCTVGSASQPAAYAGNRLLDCDGEVPHNETTIVVDPNNASHAVGAYHSYQLVQTGNKVHVHVVATPSVTFDGGTTWREVGTPITPYQFTGDPALAFAANGTLYFANIADHEGQGGSNYTGPSVVVASSADGGLSWSNPVTVASGLGNAGSNGQLVFNDKEFIAADANATGSPFKNRLYVTWTRYQQSKTSFRAPIVLSSSSDGGKTWSQSVELSGFSPACSVAFLGRPNECDLDQFSSPVVAPGGKLYVGFENFNTPAQNQYMVVRSANGGASFSSPVKVDDIDDVNMPLNVDGRETLTGCQLRYAAPGNLAADPSDPSGQTVYATWSDNRNGSATATNTDVFLARSTNGGQSWTTYTLDNAANDQFMPWVAVSNSGRVDVGYMDRSYQTESQATVCKYGFSLRRVTFPGGTFTLGAKARVDTGLSNPGKSRWFSGATAGNSLFIGDYNGIAVGSDGKTWSLWTDQRADATNAIPPNRIKGQHAVAAITP
jgi:hypothetical protein